jgi:hypothetical protein
MDRSSGTALTTSKVIATAISGTTTTSRRESEALSLIAMITPPMLVTIAGTSRLSAMPTSNSTWSASLVLRVIRDGMPNRFTSCAEKARTLR